MDCEEINVTAPWGHIAVRIWGNQQNPAVLMFHGLIDNVGTFDRIIPLLPHNYYYICVDLPGHGKSTHWPSKTIINSLDLLLAYEVIVRYFKRLKYIIIGHSLGGQLSYVYSQLYPDRVQKLIMLDVIFMLPVQTDTVKTHLLNIHKSYFDTMEKLRTSKLPEYTYDEALEKLSAKRVFGKLTKEAAKPLLDRMIVQHENGKVGLSYDQSLKFILHPLFTSESMYNFIETYPVECPVLFILSTDTEIHELIFKQTIELHKSRKNMKITYVKGGHNVHNVDPITVAPLITSFLLNTSKL